MPDQRDATDRLKETYAVLVGDCEQVQVLLSQSDTPCLRRVFVRVVSAHVEGMANQLKQVVLDALKLKEFPGAKDELGFNDSDIAGLKNDRLGMVENFRVAVGCYSKLYRENLALGSTDKLKELVTLRNRITHPHSAADLAVSDDDLNGVVAAAEWYMEEMVKLFTACNAKS